jgi:hypothetical protein
MKPAAHPVYATVPQLGGGYSIVYSDRSVLTGYGPIPELFRCVPCIRFDRSWNDYCREWVRAVFAARVDDRSIDAVAYARAVGLVVEG